MGTFYDLRCALVLDGPARDAWLRATVAAMDPWSDQPGPVRALLAALEEGDAPINGHRVGPLPITMNGPHVTWSWKEVPSEVAPEIILVSKALWQAAAPLATRGLWGHRDALGPHTLWDTVLLLMDSRIVDIAQMFPVVELLLRDDPDAVEPVVEFDEDIPF
jgi:hypothetical protein